MPAEVFPAKWHNNAQILTFVSYIAVWPLFQLNPYDKKVE